jgi:hypothetical protein
MYYNFSCKKPLQNYYFSLNDYFTMLSACFFLSMEREGEGERVHFAWKQAVQNSISKG